MRYILAAVYVNVAALTSLPDNERACHGDYLDRNRIL